MPKFFLCTAITPLSLLLALSCAGQKANPSFDVRETSFEAADLNGNGYLDRKEFERAAAKEFGRLDRNGDSYLSGIELSSLPSSDEDADGKVSIIEFMKNAPARFGAADKNGDGELSKSESAPF